MALEKDLAVYIERLHSELAPHEGKYVLIHDGQIEDYFNTYEDAIKEGYQKFGPEPFLVKQILAMEEIHFVSRLADPCLISLDK